MPKPHKRQRRADSGIVAVDRGMAAEHVSALLQIEPDQHLLARLDELGAETPGGSLALVEALGEVRSDAAGRLLADLARRAPDKELRKSARRGLHRLRAAGVEVDIPVVSEAPAARPTSEAHLAEAHATSSDGVGSRAAWLVLERPLGGLAVFGLVLNDVVGLKDCNFLDTTRKKFGETLRGWRANPDIGLVDLPTDYALALVSEALALNAESGLAIPTEFQLHRRTLGELPPPPEDALIHRHVTRGQALLLPNLLDESAEPLEQDELKGWFFGYDESIARAGELRQARESRLVLTRESPEERERRVLDAAINELFTPTMRRAIRRRLEETAYIFWTTGRERAARQVVAAAFALGQHGSLTRHPFARAMVEKSLELALEAERAGIDAARLRRSPYDPV